MDPFQVPSYLPAVQTYSQKFNQTYNVAPGMMGVDTYDAFYIAKNAIENAGTVDKAAVRASNRKHQHGPKTHLDQLPAKFNSAQALTTMKLAQLHSWSNSNGIAETNKLESQIIWPATDTRHKQLQTSRLQIANRLPTWKLN